ncbi:tetratricopeptide (TPR) repeat protein [Parabacteroides sp. PFB2-12]|uniref:tetratricopeptide repeat protein n=1 Tax=Parabacteroides sp. PFB2-12 TaxID=2940652 RepID=UPI00247438B0|nr:tetratricopeptide repeat protein [Parabacteroides sp. PFB2-12]MDH6344280.1 tetratricopeptide (TPR) repeat protein [Parabacteroides sp. PM6-13]MDH6391184.1 tetratricopeptide (TPR) repeat protein [Parabacteroides sp. PFB2-12]
MRPNVERVVSDIPERNKQNNIYMRIFYIFLLLLTVAGSAFSQTDQRKFDYFYYEGLNLKAAGKYDAAFDALSHCLSIDSTAAPVLYELSFFYMQLDRPEKTVEYLRRAVENSSDNYTYRMALASVNRSLGMFDEAVEEYRKLSKQYPEKMDLVFYLADALTQKGDIAESIEAYDTLESAVGMNEALSQQKFRLYMQIEEKEKAYKEIEKLANKFPMDARYPLMLGDLYLENKEMDKALQNYEKAHKIDPQNPYYVVSMSNYYEAIGDNAASESLIRDALVNEKLDVETKVGILSRYIIRLQHTEKGMEGANAIFDELIEQHPEDIDLKLMYGSLLTAQEKKEEAEFQFQLVTEMEPGNASAWQQLLNLALRNEQLDEVVRICTTCMDMFPDAPEYYFYLGIAYYQQDKQEEALQVYRDGIAIIPAENGRLKSDFYGQMGDIYYQMEQLDKTYEAYDEALKYNMNNVMVLNNYAYFLALDKKDLDKALRMSLQTINMESENATYLDTYAWILFVKGEYKLAKIYIERAIEHDDTNSSELVDHYGDILFMIGEKERAVEQWKKAKELGKEGEVLDRKIAEEAYFEE